MSHEGRKYKVGIKSTKVTGQDAFAEISRDEMVAKTTIQARASAFAFDKNNEKQEIAASFFKRTMNILIKENIIADQKVVAELVTKHFPDWRRVLNELQRYSVSGKIDSGILLNVTEESFKQLINNLKEKNYTQRPASNPNPHKTLYNSRNPKP